MFDTVNMENETIVKIFLIAAVWILILFVTSIGGISIQKVIACLLISVGIMIAPLKVFDKKST
jgi:hypothetical protein